MSSASIEGPLILIVEDDAQVRRFLRTSLPAHGYRVLEAENGAQAVRMASQYVPELVLLDLGLPDLDGLEVVRQVRSWSRAPILILSARGQERSKVEALDAGADDFLTKPFGFPELLARMRAALRRAQQLPQSSDQVFECQYLRVDLGERRVHCNGQEVHLTPIEFRLLSVLARNAGKVVTQKQLLTEVWGPQSVDHSEYLRVYMTHLRRKLDPGAGRGRIFRTEAGVGYRLQCAEE